MKWIKRLWKKHKIKELRLLASRYAHVGRFGQGRELNELADRMECELKGVPYTKPEYTNPFLDDEGNLPAGYTQQQIKEGSHPARRCRKQAGREWPAPPPSVRPAFVYMKVQADAERSET